MLLALELHFLKRFAPYFLLLLYFIDSLPQNPVRQVRFQTLSRLFVDSWISLYHLIIFLDHSPACTIDMRIYFEVRTLLLITHR